VLSVAGNAAQGGFAGKDAALAHAAPGCA